MDFWLSDDERDLQDGIRSFLLGRFPIDVIRAGEEQPGVIDRDRWRELAATGVFSVAADMGMRAAVLVFEELGRALVPSPLAASALAAAWVSGTAAGETIVGVLETLDDPVVVEHPAQVDVLLIVSDEGLLRLDASALTMHTIERPLDTLTPVAVVRRPLPAATLVDNSSAARQFERDAVVLTSALQLGVALGATHLAQEYAKQREQFGRPIGGFQAVKHLLADMLVKAEVARSGELMWLTSVKPRKARSVTSMPTHSSTPVFRDTTTFSLGAIQVTRFMQALAAERDSVLIDLPFSRSTARSGSAACRRLSMMAETMPTGWKLPAMW